MADLIQETAVQNQSFSGAYTIGKSNRGDLGGNNESPAPNLYQQNRLYETNQLKKQSSQPEIRFNKIPGPKWTKGVKSDIFSTKQVAPPPGTYTLKSDFEKNNKSQTISCTPFIDMNDKVLAGPLDYDNNTLKIKNKSPVFSLGSKDEDITRFHTYMHTPGPQKYQLKPIEMKKSHNKKQIGFGSGDRNSIYKNDNVKNPGPGSYNYQDKNTIKRAAKIGTSKREGMELKTIQENPGTGAYDIDKSYQSLYKTHQASIKNRNNNDSIMSSNKNNPGPGHYPLNNSIYKKTPAFKIGTSQRQPLNKNNKVPGPGTYSKIFESQISHADLDVYQGFGTNPRGQMFEERLGPGPQQYQSYVYKTTLTKGPKINPDSTTTKPSDENEKPGPFSYDVNRSDFDNNRYSRYKGISIKTKSTSMDYKDIPGPGAYSIRGKMSEYNKGTKFGPTNKLEKFSSQSVFQTSPASYNIKSNIGALPSYHKKHNQSQY